MKRFFFFFLFIFFSTAFKVQASQAHWTVLIYMSGQNNLSAACVEDVLEMMEVGSTNQVNVVVQADVSSKYTPEVPDNVTYRFKVLKHDLLFFPLDTNLDMGAPETLTDFIEWGVRSFPAQHYALFLWDHGYGWKDGVFEQQRGGRGVLQDEGAGSFMSMPELRDALHMAGIHFDLIEFDACLMAHVEVLGYVAPYSDYVTFSQDTEPGDGDPYDILLRKLTDSPDMDPVTLGKAIVDTYIDYYSSPGHDFTSVTKSLVSTSTFPALSSRLDALGNTLLEALEESVTDIVHARGRTQSFTSFPGSVDLVDFLRHLEEDGFDQGEMEDFVSFLQNEVILHERHHNSSYSFGSLLDTGSVEGANGISISVPGSDDISLSELVSYSELCDTLGLAQWGAFVEHFVKVSGEEPVQKVKGGFIIEAYWEDALGLPSSADLDLYIVEPGDVFAPWMGQSTPNGFFSADSKDSGKNYEVYVSKDIVEKGTYVPVINYYYDAWVPPSEIAFCYLLYFQSGGQSPHITLGPRAMGLWNPAPAVWDDYVITLLSMNFYSDWWIPTSFEQRLQRAPLEFQRSFWQAVRHLSKTRKKMSQGHWDPRERGK